MKQIVLTFGLFLACAWPAWATNVYFLGETHDNPVHHLQQAERVKDIAPSALVFEMLSEAQASRVTPDLLQAEPAVLEAVLGWNASGWPDFLDYYPIFAAAGSARIYGAAIPRNTVRAAMGDLVGAFAGDSDLFGLAEPLPDAQQEQREALQMAAHCDALPEAMLPMMVQVQRLRDAEIARVALQAFEDTGGPVVVITGNGHARRDWGAPAALERAAPTLTIFALGQSEAGNDPGGQFDEVIDAPAAEREDPCLAFRKS